MIVRIMGLGQWSMEPDQLISLNEVDEAVEKSVASGDQEALSATLAELVAGVKKVGQPVPDDVIVESDLVLPDVDATVDDVRALLDSTQEFYGLIPDSHSDGGDRA